MKGELRPSKNRSQDGPWHLVPTFLHMDDSFNELLVFWCDHFRDSDGYHYVTASWVPDTIFTLRDTIIPFVRS